MSSERIGKRLPEAACAYVEAYDLIAGRLTVTRVCEKDLEAHHNKMWALVSKKGQGWAPASAPSRGAPSRQQAVKEARATLVALVNQMAALEVAFASAPDVAALEELGVDVDMIYAEGRAAAEVLAGTAQALGLARAEEEQTRAELKRLGQAAPETALAPLRERRRDAIRRINDLEALTTARDGGFAARHQAISDRWYEVRKKFT